MNKTKYLSISLFIFSSLIQANTVEFVVIDENKKPHYVQSAFVYKELRNIPIDKLEEASKYLNVYVNKLDNGEYTIHANARGLGGGIWGTIIGSYIGKFVVHFIGHGTILVVGGLTGPAAPATIAALEATFLPAIEAASNVGAIAGGIVGGVATGPV